MIFTKKHNLISAKIRASLFILATTISSCVHANAEPYSPKYVLDVQQVGNFKTYNGVYPGPTLRTKAGDNLDVELKNSLPALNDDCTANMNRAHGENTTNLHTHGLHVSPDYDSSGEYYADNVFVSLVPEGQIVECDTGNHMDGSSSDMTHGMEMDYNWGKVQYRFELPEDHVSGTFWYHAHKHGSTAEQVGGGLAGPLIVEDRLGFMPDYIAAANELVFVIGNKGLYLANEEGGGVLDPAIEIAPGEVQRWRIINAMGNGLQYRIPYLSLEGLEVYMIAYDGLTLENRVSIDTNNFDKPWLNPAALASGNRLDLIVHAPENYQPKANTASMPNQSFLSSLLSGRSIASAVEFRISVIGDPVDMMWSTKSNLPGTNLQAVTQSSQKTRNISFTARNTIDDKSFDGSVKQTMLLNTSEAWTVTNETQMLHIYHIHVNPFYVTHLNGEELAQDSPLRRWQDTVGVPPQSNRKAGSVTFRTRYEKFTGKFVLHCHVLAHEDQGMMQIVEIISSK